ncbi:bifunctional 3'-5' exonuclease/DNA polymerase [Aquipuribacter sp. SD81]|uniref:bifunctional 3'-5' exonuclease/DNA polymerase n=1 Tax=Aquipuribacter sp. SD81 TaxID=3127703 RepID=UPI0030172F59
MTGTVLLQRLAGGDVTVTDLTDAAGAGGSAGPTTVPADRLADLVRGREATDPPRWVWDCTTRWYPSLLRDGVRVGRCWDLRLVHALLAGSPLVPRAAATDDGTASAWASLRPSAPVGATLFDDADDGTGLDAAAEWHRQQAALATAPDGRLRLLCVAESSGALVATEMTAAGLPWRADVHDAALTRLLGPRPPVGQRPRVLEGLAARVRESLDAPSLNPDSQPALLGALRAAGLDVADTRSSTLERLEHPVAPILLEYKALARLLSTNGWHWLDTWVHDGRFRPEYLVAGVVTGRWSSRGGGALTVPAPVREAVVADDGWRLVVADAAQLEPRVLAGMSRDGAMAAAGRAGDLYEGMVASGAVATRAEAKLGILGAMYGGTRGESGRMVERLARRYPAAFGLVEAAARAGERGEVVATLLGRGSPAPNGSWTAPAVEGVPRERTDERERRAWGRFTRNFVVQGTAAEWALAWLALLRGRLDGLTGGTGRPELVMFLHDEVLVHTPDDLADATAEAAGAAADEATRLLFGDGTVDVPLDVRVVRSWAEAGH